MTECGQSALPPYTEVEHTADLCIAATGRDRAELFCNTTLGMMALMGFESAGGVATAHEIVVKGSGYEALLVGWLNEVLYLSESEQGDYATITIQAISEESVRGVVSGYRGRNSQRQLKAATFSELVISEHPAGDLSVRVVFDV